MKEYFYKNGDRIQAGGICFYSESPGDSTYHYANSITEIVEDKGELSFRTLYFTQDDGLTFIRNTDLSLISLKHCTVSYFSDNILQHFYKVGWSREAYSIEEDLKFFNKNFGRKNQKRKINKFIQDN